MFTFISLSSIIFKISNQSQSKPICEVLPPVYVLIILISSMAAVLFVLFLRHLYYILVPFKNLRIVVSHMRKDAIRAVFKAALRIDEVAAAAIPQHIERTIAEQTVEIFRLVRLVTGEKFALFMLVKCIFLISEIVIHDFLL